MTPVGVCGHSAITDAELLGDGLDADALGDAGVVVDGSEVDGLEVDGLADGSGAEALADGSGVGLTEGADEVGSVSPLRGAEVISVLGAAGAGMTLELGATIEPEATLELGAGLEATQSAGTTSDWACASAGGISSPATIATDATGIRTFTWRKRTRWSWLFMTDISDRLAGQGR